MIRNVISSLFEYTPIRIYEVKLEVVSPLHIGTGARGESLQPLFKVYVPRLGRMTPIIPSNTIKGVFRATSEVLSKASVDSLARNDIEKICIMNHREDEHEVKNPIDLFNKLGIDELMLIELGVPLDKAEAILDSIRERRKDATAKAELALSYVLPLLCPICRLYGSRNIASRVSFTSAIPLEPVNTIFRTIIGIDRKTMTARKGALVTYELVPPGTQFSFKIVLKGIKDNSPEYNLFKATLDYIKNFGLQIGALKSRGYGLVNVTGVAEKELLFTNVLEDLKKLHES